MARVEVDADSLQWPARCCRCGSAQFKLRPFSEKVVLWTTLGVTKSMNMSLTIPVCDRCAHAQYVWFAAAAVLGGLGLLPIGLWTRAPNALLVVFVLAIVLAFIGTRKRPLRIVKLDEKTNRLSLDIHDDKVAQALRRPPAAGKGRGSRA